MNAPESNSAAVIVNIRVDKDTHFKRTIEHYINGVLANMTYWEVEFVVFWPTTCKELKAWSLTSGDLVYSSLGTITWDILIDMEKGSYEYYYKTMDENGDIRKYYKGKFIVE